MNKVLKYKGFLGSVELCLEDGIIYGQLLFANDLITYEADAVSELQKEFEAAVDDYIETCEQLGREAKKPCSGTFNVRIGRELHQQAGEYAAENGIKINEVVKISMAKFFEVPKKQEVIHNHIHTIQSREMISTKELSILPVTSGRAGANYEITTVLQ